MSLKQSIDIGTTALKTGDGMVLPSGISERIFDMANNVMTVEGKRYAMEQWNEVANYDVNSNKALNRYVRLNYLYALYKSTEDFAGMYTDVLVGLPAKQYENEETINMYKKLLAFDNIMLIDVNGIKKEIYVDSVGIVPEDFPSYYTDEVNRERFKGDRVLMLGIGSWNSNQYLIEQDEIIKSDSNELGCLKLYCEIASFINSKYNSDEKPEGIHKVLLRGLPHLGKFIDIKPSIKDIVMDYSKKFYNNLKLKFSIDTMPYVIAVGGGSIFLAEYLREYIPHLELIQNAQTVSAKGMKYMLEVSAS